MPYWNDEKYLKEVMEKGAEKARKSAKATMELVREAMGLIIFDFIANGYDFRF